MAGYYGMYGFMNPLYTMTRMNNSTSPENYDPYLGLGGMGGMGGMFSPEMMMYEQAMLRGQQNLFQPTMAFPQNTGAALGQGLGQLFGGIKSGMTGQPMPSQGSGQQAQPTQEEQQLSGLRGLIHSRIASIMSSQGQDYDAGEAQYQAAAGLIPMFQDQAWAQNELRAYMRDARENLGYTPSKDADIARKTQAETLAENQDKLDRIKSGDESNFQVVDSSKKDPNGFPLFQTYGTAIPMYPDGNNKDPQFSDKTTKALQDARAAGATNPVLMSVKELNSNRGLYAGATAQAAQRRQDTQYGSLTPDGLKYASVDSLFNPGSVNYRGPEKSQIQNLFAQNHILPNVQAAAIQEAKGLQIAANSAERRRGTMLTFEQSMPQLGQNLKDAFAAVPRVDASWVNKAIKFGRQAFNNPAEANAAAQLQTYVNEYARVMNGGTGISSDQAREDAMALFGKNPNQAVIGAVVDALGKKETETIANASSQAAELLANPKQYKNLIAIQQRLGIPGFNDGDFQNYTAPTLSASSSSTKKPLSSFYHQ